MDARKELDVLIDAQSHKGSKLYVRRWERLKEIPISLQMALDRVLSVTFL
jgi:hypothetical protein